MKLPLASLTIAIAGQFKAKDPDIQRWIIANGGSFAPKVDESVTHLVCTLPVFKARVSKVKHAIKLGLYIMTYDWLEDSLMKKRRLAERGKYMMWRFEISERKEAKRAMREKKKQDNKKKREIEKDGKLYKQSIEEYHLEMGFRTHHIYKDQTGFVYDILLSRVIDIASNKNEHFLLKIYESNALPHLYAAVARYRRPGAQAVEVLAPVASFFHEAFTAFRQYFKRFTGREWENRLNTVEEGPIQGVETNAVVKRGVSTIDRSGPMYKYWPPQPKKPRGVLPHGKVPKGEPVEVIELSSDDPDEEEDTDDETEEEEDEEETDEDEEGSGDQSEEEEEEDESEDQEVDSSDACRDSDSSSGAKT